MMRLLEGERDQSYCQPEILSTLIFRIYVMKEQKKNMATCISFGGT